MLNTLALAKEKGNSSTYFSKTWEGAQWTQVTSIGTASFPVTTNVPGTTSPPAWK